MMELSLPKKGEETIMEISVPTYDRWFHFEWEDGYSLRCTVQNSEVVLEGNKEGLISLARHLLELAQDHVPEYTHFHLDQYNDLEEGSSELIIVRRNF